MDHALGVSTVKSQKAFKKSRRNRGIKVVYISSPMKVKTSASEFRALVQELTGRDSDAERSFETITNGRSDEGLATMKKEVREHVDSRESDFCFGFNFGFGLCDFLTSPLQEFGNDSIIFN